MSLQVTNIQRKFLLDNGKKGKEELEDPGDHLSPDEVLKWHSNSREELTNAKVEGPVVSGDTATYTIKTKAGKLG